MTRKVLLTGGNGFVGRHLLRGLREHDLDVRLVLRSGQETPVGVSDVVDSADIFAEDADWWERACRDVDTIVHAAWYAVPGQYLHASENLDSLVGTLALAQGARRFGVARFIGIGTCVEYDLGYDVLGIDTPLKPETPYGACKAAAFLALSQVLPQAGISFAWCRLFYLYGHGEDPRRLVPYVRQQLAAGEIVELTNGLQVRDFMDVAEAGARIVRVALGRVTGPVNICSGTPTTVRELVEGIADEFGRRDLLRFGARAGNAVDPEHVLGIPTPLPDDNPERRHDQ